MSEEEAKNVPQPPEGVPQPPAGAPAAPEGAVAQEQPTTQMAGAPMPAPEAAQDGDAGKKPHGNKKLVIGIIAAIVVVIGAYAFVTFKNNTATTARLDIGSSASEIASADSELIELDEYAALDYASLVLSDPSQADDMFSSAEGSLDSAQTYLDSAKSKEWALDDSDKGAISALQASIDTRREMIDTGEHLVDDLSGLYDASSELASYYTNLSLFETSVGSVVDTLNASTDIDAIDKTSLATDLSQAKDYSASLSEAIQAAQSAAPEADLSAYQTVVDNCSNMTDILSQLVDAVNASNVDAANSLSDSYNQARQTTLDSVNAAPYLSDIEDILVSDSDRNLAEGYWDARDKTVAATEPLASYQGVDVSALVEDVIMAH